jgi:hypothetical protein
VSPKTKNISKAKDARKRFKISENLFKYFKLCKSIFCRKQGASRLPAGISGNANSQHTITQLHIFLTGYPDRLKTNISMDIDLTPELQENKCVCFFHSH